MEHRKIVKVPHEIPYPSMERMKPNLRQNENLFSLIPSDAALIAGKRVR
ncbi:MAG: hypothetical protein KA369_14765 [Spirochaetes bacterium]|nr:hypothetical protein [Spirochaetota bacterium]